MLLKAVIRSMGTVPKALVLITEADKHSAAFDVVETPSCSRQGSTKKKKKNTKKTTTHSFGHSTQRSKMRLYFQFCSRKSPVISLVTLAPGSTKLLRDFFFFFSVNCRLNDEFFRVSLHESIREARGFSLAHESLFSSAPAKMIEFASLWKFFGRPSALLHQVFLGPKNAEGSF